MPQSNDDLLAIIARFVDRMTADFAALADKVQSWQRRQVDLESYDIETRKRQEADRARITELQAIAVFNRWLLWILIPTIFIVLTAFIIFLLAR